VGAMGALGDETPGAWVRTVALNLCRSRWRQLQRGLRLAPRLYATPRPAEIRDLDLVEALRHLSARQREAVVLYYWADQSVEDCAGLMAISAGAVKPHLSRAREHLAHDPAIAPLEGTT
jgi:RNA polymerase sigma-70 factor (ECF subfamily)